MEVGPTTRSSSRFGTGEDKRHRLARDVERATGGVFAFYNVPVSASPQLVSVMVQAAGYAPWTITNVRVFENDATQTDVRLEAGGRQP